MDELYYTRTGKGEPLLLIHGLGDDHRTWDQVLPDLSQFDVIAVDLPGHGRSPRIPADVTPTPEYLRDRLVALLDMLGIDKPHIAGNSLGGWLALELGRIDRARSLTLLSPAGLWSTGEQKLNKALFVLGRTVVGTLQPFVHASVRTAAGRIAVLALLSAHPVAVSVEAADSFIRALAGSTGFYDIRRVAQSTCFRGGRKIAVPVTVAFGAKDRILPPNDQGGDELPPQAVWSPLPECGHIPMLDDARLVAETIRVTAGSAAKRV